MNKEALLSQKVKILENGVRLRDRYIHQLHMEIRLQPFPIDECIKTNHLLEILSKHEKELHTLDVEIENIELKQKAEFARLKEKLRSKEAAPEFYPSSLPNCYHEIEYLDEKPKVLSKKIVYNDRIISDEDIANALPVNMPSKHDEDEYLAFQEKLHERENLPR